MAGIYEKPLVLRTMRGKREVVHGQRRVATIYGCLNDVLYVPEKMKWQEKMWPAGVPAPALVVLHRRPAK